MERDSETTKQTIREIVYPKPGGAAHGPGMVPGVKAAGLIFFSAIRGNAPGTPMSDDTKDQARQAFKSASSSESSNKHLEKSSPTSTFCAI